MAADELGLLPDPFLGTAMICREVARGRGVERPLTKWIPGTKEIEGQQSAEQMRAIMESAWS